MREIQKKEKQNRIYIRIVYTSTAGCAGGGMDGNQLQRCRNYAFAVGS